MPAGDHGDHDGSVTSWLGLPLTHYRQMFERLYAVAGFIQSSQQREYCQAQLEALETRLRPKTAVKYDLQLGVLKEFVALSQKKFHTTCPQLYMPWRMFVGKWVARLMKTKRGDFDQSLTNMTDSVRRLKVVEDESDDAEEVDSDDAHIADEAAGRDRIALQNAIPDKLRGSKDGTPVTVYLFNDSVLVSAKRQGKSIAKLFYLLDDVSMIHSNAALPVAGLKVVVNSIEHCHVLRMKRAKDMAAFAEAVLVEQAINSSSLQIDDEVML